MIKHGTRPTYPQRTDYDFHRTFGTVVPPSFPDAYDTDSGLTMPNQNAEGLPFGCTDEAQADLSTDETGAYRNPFDLDAVTHANALGGYDMRKSLDAAMKLGWFSAYFNIRPQQLDFFDTVRLAMLSGVPEKRSVSVGVPWFFRFEQVDSTGILTPPTNYSTANLPWHNAKIAGWKTINGSPYLLVKSWQGANYGDKGWCYMSRDLFNSLMNIPGAVAFTATAIKPDTIRTVDMGAIRWLFVYLKTLIGYAY